MVNLENKLTVDDLIVEYMIYKVKNGYEPSFLTSEFMSFLYFFESKMEVHDVLYENDKLFQRFFERKNEHDWFYSKTCYHDEKIVEPHMDMVYSKKNNDYLIKANYKLSEYDRSVINTYFMPGGSWGEGKTKKIRNIIGEYLTNYPKRTIDESTDVYAYHLTVGKYVAAEILINIWEHHKKQQIKFSKLIELYKDFYKKIAILYYQDKNLQISTYSNVYLARSNYELLINGYEEEMNKTFGPNKKSLDIDLSTLTIKESHINDGVCYWGDDFDIASTTTTVGNDRALKMIKKVEKVLVN